MKKLLAVAGVLVVALPLLAPRAEAQFAFIPYLGYDIDVEELFLGVAVQFDLPVGAPIALAVRPGAEYFFVGSGVTLMQFNGDVVATLMPAAPVGVFAGAGLAIRHVSIDGVDASSTDLGLNLFGGAEFGTGFLVPFVQARLTVADGSAVAFMGGARLNL